MCLLVLAGLLSFRLNLKAVKESEKTVKKSKISEKKVEFTLTDFANFKLRKVKISRKYKRSLHQFGNTLMNNFDIFISDP